MIDAYPNYVPDGPKHTCVECGNPSAYNSLRCKSHLDAAVYHRRMLRDGYKVEEQVRYIYADRPGPIRTWYVNDQVGPVAPSDDIAGAPFMMESCIAWVETRYVKTTDWKQL